MSYGGKWMEKRWPVGGPSQVRPARAGMRTADEIAALIELRIGTAGANFPGAAELYEAVRKITEWKTSTGG